MLKRTLSLIAALVIFATFTGCNHSSSKDSSTVKTNFSVTGSGQNAVASLWDKSFSFVLNSAVALTPPPLEDSTGMPVTLNEAWIVLKKIQFKATESGDDNGENSYHYNGPFYVDLLSDSPIEFGEVELSKDGLHRVKMLLHKGHDLPAGTPAALDDKSIYLNASTSNGSFTFAADDTTDFDVSGPNAVYPEEGKDLMVVIRMADLLKKIDLSSISGTVSITSSSRVAAVDPCPDIFPNAADLYTCFVKGIAMEAKFGKDNGDKDIDND